MNFYKKIVLLLTIVTLFTCKNDNKSPVLAESTTAESKLGEVKVIPITHGTMVLEADDNIIYVDPTGGFDAFKNQKKPTIILITDIHGDHLSIKTLKALDLKNSTLIAPKAVIEKLPTNISKTIVTLNNEDTFEINNILIEAIPMYNLREEALKFHTKGRGNGYVLTVGKERIYISGDTEDIPEMRNLEDIDKAFVCMNLPYTMTVESAASAVLEFKPKQVYPYHYRGTSGLSDIKKFESLINTNDPEIEVKLLKWY